MFGIPTWSICLAPFLVIAMTVLSLWGLNKLRKGADEKQNATRKTL